MKPVQVEAALKAGVLKENIYGDKITGVSRYGDRPEYSKMVALLQSDDLVITEGPYKIWKVNGLNVG